MRPRQREALGARSRVVSARREGPCCHGDLPSLQTSDIRREVYVRGCGLDQLLCVLVLWSIPSRHCADGSKNSSAVNAMVVIVHDVTVLLSSVLLALVSPCIFRKEEYSRNPKRCKVWLRRSRSLRFQHDLELDHQMKQHSASMKTSRPS